MANENTRQPPQQQNDPQRRSPGQQQQQQDQKPQHHDPVRRRDPNVQDQTDISRGVDTDDIAPGRTQGANRDR